MVDTAPSCGFVLFCSAFQNTEVTLLPVCLSLRLFALFVKYGPLFWEKNIN
jgi:hypothetical protein